MNATLNAAPTTSATALLNNAIDLGLTVCECPVGDGFLIVKGAWAAVEEWVNGTANAFVTRHGDSATAAREVRA